MAEEAVGPIAELVALIASEANKLRNVQAKVDLLQNELKLVDQYVKGIKDNRNQLTKEFVRQIRVLVHKAEDVIERHIGSSSWDLWNLRKTGEYIDGIRDEFKQLWEKKKEFEIPIGETAGESSSAQDDAHKQSQSRPPSNDILVGLKDKVELIIEQLTGEGYDDLDVIGIEGMSGIGKTTLAGEVYGDDRVQNHFPMREWVFVSKKDERKVLEKLMKDMVNTTQEEMKKMNDTELGSLLASKLRGTRFLIVLDDVWNSKFWEKNLIDLLAKDMSGSRIIVTTQDNRVTSSLKRRNEPHKMKYLEDTESWRLLSKKVFGEGKCPLDLVSYGETIAKNCGGLPLAIVVIAGYLLNNGKTDITVWEFVSKTVPAIFNEARTSYDAGEIFALSYRNLPEKLQTCFRYFANFPEGSVIPSRKLTSLWVAEGYISPIDGVSLEKIAEQYLRELINRNLILLVHRKQLDDGVKTCRIHNLLRVFSITKSKEEIDELEVRGKDNASVCCKSRRLAIHHSTNDYVSNNKSTSSLRSLLCFGKDGERISKKEWELIYKHYDLMRVLDLWGVDVDNIPKKVKKLSRLKYLRLKSDSDKIFLPLAISKLRYLQFLEVGAAFPGEPKLDIWEMPNLRHFYLNGEVIIPEPTNATNKANNLQSLSTISPKSCTDRVLSRLPFVVKLGIYGDLETHYEVAFNNLSKLELLQKLKLKGNGRYLNLSKFPNQEKFPPMLVRLTLLNTKLVNDPMGQLGKLGKLQVLKLLDSSYSGTRLDCDDSVGFPELRVLKLVNIGITSWVMSNGSMPKLKKLVTDTCDKLEYLPANALQMISTLCEIELSKASDTVVGIAKEIEASVGNDKLKLTVYR